MSEIGGLAPQNRPHQRWRADLWKTPLRRGLILGTIIFGFTGALNPAEGADKPEKLYFSGRLIELDATKHTFAVRVRVPILASRGELDHLICADRFGGFIFSQ